MLSAIAAIARNNVIGRDNKLLWYLPEDMKRFKNLTTNHKIIMGMNTFNSLPHMLPKRYHVVMTRNTHVHVVHSNFILAHSIDDIMPLINDEEEHFVIGGGQIYELLLPYCNKMYITIVEKDYDGDTFFPEINPFEWNLSEEGDMHEHNGISYRFITFTRR